MKQHSIKPFLMALFCILATSLLAVPVAQGTTQSIWMTFAPDVVEERVDCLITFLKQKTEMQIPDDFKTVSGLKDALSHTDKPGIVVEAENAERALNNAAKKLLNNLLNRTAEDNPYREIVVALVESVDDLPDGYCEPEGYETGKDLKVAGHDLIDDREKYKDPPLVQPASHENPVPPIPPIPPIPDNWNFIYYGKGYLLPTDVADAQNGILFLSSDSFHSTGSYSGNTLQGLDAYPPFIAPLWIMSHDSGAPFEADEEGNLPSIDQVFSRPKVSGTPSFYRYAYNTEENAPTAPFSSTLYMNPASSDSDWILFSYGDVQLPYDQYEAFVGLVPGNGSENHPGPGQLRDLAPVDLSEGSGKRIGDTTDYLWIYETFEKNDTSSKREFDLADHFLIFRPDGDNKYTVTAGTRDMVVDSLGLDEKETSLDMAVMNLRDPDLLARVDGNAFQSGIYFWDSPDPNAQFPGIEDWPILWGDPDNQNYYYRYGIQTVGQDSKGNVQVFTDWDSLNKMNGNGLLAYAVQVEEDRVNKKIIEIARDADALKLRVDTIKNQLQCGDIRARDALLAQVADAQSGRVTRDRMGNWVRAQQYILRPDNKTVQVLNVSLRGQDAGDLAGLSTMDFTTTFKEGYDGDLRCLPWGGWLGTQTDGNVKWVNTGGGSPDLDQMYVKFTNPSGESLKESRWFGEKAYCVIHQFVMGEELEVTSLKDGTHTYGYHYTDALSDPELYPANKVTLPDGSYGIENIRGGGFNYTFAGESTINVAFFKVDDYGKGPVESVAFADIWDALRVNETWGSPNIGDNNLEIAIDGEANYFDKPVDVVYIPMSRMLWKTKEYEN